MKNTILRRALIGVIASLCVAVFGGLVASTKQNTTANGLTLKGEPSKKKLILGEPLTVEFAFINRGEKAVDVAGTGVESGGLKIYIAKKQDGEYKEYFIGSWGRQRGRYITLEPGKTYKLELASILWHGLPRVSHLNEVAAERLLKGKITTEYAFQEPGIYLLKGRSYFGGNASPIESEAIEIEIQQPTGENLEVWNKIKGDKQIARLLQNASFDTDQSETKQRLIQTVEQLLLHHPNSLYSGYFRPNLQKYKTDEERRNRAYPK